MQRKRIFTAVVSAALFAACGSDQSSGATTTSGSAVTTTEQAPTTTEPAPTTSESALPEQQAIWPAADVVFATPEAAAADFVAKVFGDGPVLGEFQAGDSRSGEIEVFASVDGAPIGEARSVLALRQLGPSDGWFVLAAANEHETITAPTSMATVPAGRLTVEGVGRGFEATIVVNGFVAGHADREFDRVVTMAGNFDETLPYSVSLDLSDASPGDLVVLLVRGGAGLETDPGEFGAVPVLIGG